MGDVAAVVERESDLVAAAVRVLLCWPYSPLRRLVAEEHIHA